MSISGSLFLIVLLLTANAEAQQRPDLTWGRSVVKVMADTKSGRVSMGSGVVVAPDRVATNCHVTRNAQSIMVIKGISRYKVVLQAPNIRLDVCILYTDNLKLPIAEMGQVTDATIGNKVFVFGFPAAVGLGMVRGKITGLYNFNTGIIIQTDAGFMRGTSGGAVFSSAGKLLGLPTFMETVRSGGNYYAVPVEWVLQGLKAQAQPVGVIKGSAFWENEGWSISSVSID